MLLRKICSLIQMIYSQHFCNGMILSWPSFIKQFSFSRKKQSTANQQRFIDVLLLDNDCQLGLNQTLKCLCRSQSFSVKFKLHNTFHIISESTCLKLTFKRG